MNQIKCSTKGCNSIYKTEEHLLTGRGYLCPLHTERWKASQESGTGVIEDTKNHIHDTMKMVVDKSSDSPHRKTLEDTKEPITKNPTKDEVSSSRQESHRLRPEPIIYQELRDLIRLQFEKAIMRLKYAPDTNIEGDIDGYTDFVFNAVKEALLNLQGLGVDKVTMPKGSDLEAIEHIVAPYFEHLTCPDECLEKEMEQEAIGDIEKLFLLREQEASKRIAEWAVSSDTGTSSEAILAHMTGAENPRTFTTSPLDGSDRGRCIRLLQKFPEWIIRLGEMARYDGWAEQIPIIESELTPIEGLTNEVTE